MPPDARHITARSATPASVRCPAEHPRRTGRAAALLTAGNRSDFVQLLPVLDAIPPVRGRVGRPTADRTLSSPIATATRCKDRNGSIFGVWFHCQTHDLAWSTGAS